MKPKPIKNRSWEIKSFGKAIDILDCFTFDNKERTLTDIISQTGFDRTTARRLIANLESRNFLKQDPVSKTYSLGLRLFEMGSIVYSSFSLQKSARLHMDSLQSQLKATVLLGLREEDQIIFIDKREGPGMISISAMIGVIRPMTFGLIGKVLMAHMKPQEVEVVLKENPLKKYTSYSITDKEILHSQLKRIRKNGYAVDVNEFGEGIMGIAAPIRDYSRKAVAAIGVYLPAHLHNNTDEIKKIIDLLLSTTEKTSRDIGYF